MLNTGESSFTGEEALMRMLAKTADIKTVFDVGAGVGSKTKEMMEVFGACEIYSFEPHPKTYKKLVTNTKGLKRVKTFNLGLGKREGSGILYDISDNKYLKKFQINSNLASVYKNVLEELHGKSAKGHKVKLTKIDKFVEKNNISSIDFLKIDVEGSEYEVLVGAKNLLKKGLIKHIQFEFNEMNVYSKVYFRDFVKILSGYKIYRLMPDGPVELKEYRPVTHEIFGIQNIYAARI